jgi:hypothetical protein
MVATIFPNGIHGQLVSKIVWTGVVHAAFDDIPLLGRCCDGHMGPHRGQDYVDFTALS